MYHCFGDEHAALVEWFEDLLMRPDSGCPAAPPARHYLSGPGKPDTPMYQGKHWRRSHA
jgi:hypothetical protein